MRFSSEFDVAATSTPANDLICYRPCRSTLDFQTSVRDPRIFA